MLHDWFIGCQSRTAHRNNAIMNGHGDANPWCKKIKTILAGSGQRNIIQLVVLAHQQQPKELSLCDVGDMNDVALLPTIRICHSCILLYNTSDVLAILFAFERCAILPATTFPCTLRSIQRTLHALPQPRLSDLVFPSTIDYLMNEPLSNQLYKSPDIMSH